MARKSKLGFGLLIILSLIWVLGGSCFGQTVLQAGQQLTVQCTANQLQVTQINPLEVRVDCLALPPPVNLRIALMDMLHGETYYGFTGGLYGDGRNTPPISHATEGLRRARLVQKLNAIGQPDVNGKVVLLFIGMSNTAMEIGNAGGFIAQANTSIGINHGVILANGAAPNQTTSFWTSPTAVNYDRIRDQVLAPLGVTEAQVQLVFIKNVIAAGYNSVLPNLNAAMHIDKVRFAQTIRTVKQRYPNVQQVFMSSRTYGGWSNPPSGIDTNATAYENGYAVQSVIRAQIQQMTNGVVDPQIGDLNYATTPWIGWASYLWANGATARTDGFTWQVADTLSDRIHPSQSGVQKVGAALVSYFLNAPEGCAMRVEGCY